MEAMNAPPPPVPGVPVPAPAPPPPAPAPAPAPTPFPGCCTLPGCTLPALVGTAFCGRDHALESMDRALGRVPPAPPPAPAAGAGMRPAEAQRAHLLQQRLSMCLQDGQASAALFASVPAQDLGDVLRAVAQQLSVQAEGEWNERVVIPMVLRQITLGLDGQGLTVELALARVSLTDPVSRVMAVVADCAAQCARSPSRQASPASAACATARRRKAGRVKSPSGAGARR